MVPRRNLGVSRLALFRTTAPKIRRRPRRQRRLIFSTRNEARHHAAHSWLGTALAGYHNLRSLSLWWSSEKLPGRQKLTPGMRACSKVSTHFLETNHLLEGSSSHQRLFAFFLANYFGPLQADERKDFVITRERGFSKKVTQLVAKSFRNEGAMSPTEVRSSAVKLCHELGLASPVLW